MKTCADSTNRFPAHDISEINNHVHIRGPRVKLPLPGGECGQRHHQEEGAIQLMLVKQVGQEGDGLDGLSEPHLISKDNTVASKDKKKKSVGCLTLPKLLLT